jgi:predicted amidohydrolase
VDLARKAGDRGVVTLVGMTERRGEAMMNTQVVLDGGQVAGSYSKTMLTDGDAKEMGFRPGDALPVFQARGVCYGIIICADSSYPEVASTMVWKGARIIFSPHYNMIPPPGMDDHRIRVRNNHVGMAVHFGVVVARSNVIVTEDPEGRLGYGDSAIFSPTGVPIVEAGLFTEGLVSADVGPFLQESRWARRDRLRVDVVEQWAAAARQALGR